MPLEDLEMRLSKLEAIESIKQLKARYALACDDMHNPDDVAALFVEDGVWEHDSYVAHGREEIGQLFRQFGDMWQFSQHNMLNPLITVNGDSAVGVWYILALFTDARSGMSHWSALRYDDSYVKVGDEWLFSRLRVRPRAMIVATQKDP